jgi:WD40 repeat protein
VSDDVRPGLVDITTGEFILKFDDLGERNWDNVLAVHAAFHPSGDYVAITSPTRIYDTRTGEVVFAIDRSPNALAFSPDGSRFIILTESGFALLYDFDAVLAGATPEEALVREWQALDATGIAVGWTPDGKRLLVGGLDDHLVVFDGAGEETLLRLPTGIVGTIDFSEDGTQALVSTEFGPRIVFLDTDDLLIAARSRLTRGFTLAECAQFFPDAGCPTLEDLRG